MREAAARQTALTVLTVIPAMASPWTGNPLSVPDADGAGGFATLLLGSVSNQVAHHSACPIVIVPTGR